MFVSVIFAACTKQFNANVQYGNQLTCNNTDVRIWKIGDFIIDKTQRSIFFVSYWNQKSSTYVLFSSKNPLSQIIKTYVVLMSSFCSTGVTPPELINISFNSVCPYNSRCTREDDFQMLQQRKSIIDTATNGFPKLLQQDTISTDFEEAYCIQCANLPQIADFTGDIATITPYMAPCDTTQQRCNKLIYEFAALPNDNSQLFLNTARSRRYFDSTSKCWWCQTWPSFDYAGLPGVNQDYAEIPVISDMAERLAAIGGIQTVYDKEDLLRNVLIGTCSAGFVVISALVVLIVMKMKKTKKIKVPQSRNGFMKSQVL